MTLRQNFVEIEGLEPSLTEPESVVLPLHHISIWFPFLILGLQKYKCFIKIQNFLQKIHVKRTNSGLFVLLTELLTEFLTELHMRAIVCLCKVLLPSGRFRAGR